MSSKAQAGQRIGEYVLKGPLGEGGFATVWQASHHMWPERRVAAKQLSPLQARRHAGTIA